MDSDNEQKLGGDKPPINMEIDEFSKSGTAFGDEDEEFMSCEEGDEEDFPKISVSSGEVSPGIQLSGKVAEIVLGSDADQSESRKDEKISVGSLSLHGTDQSSIVLTASSGLNNTCAERRISQYADESKSLSSETPSCGIESACGEVRGSEAKKAEQFTHENKGNNLVLEKTLDNCNDATVCHLDENEQEKSEGSEDDYEYYDSRSSLSRIQSLSDILETSHKRRDSTAEDPHSKRSVSPLVIHKSSDVSEVGKVMDSEPTDSSLVCQPHERESFDCHEQQTGCILCFNVTPLGLGERIVQDDQSDLSQTPEHSCVLHCQDVRLTSVEPSVETMGHGLNVQFITAEPEITTSFDQSHIEQTEQNLHIPTLSTSMGSVKPSDLSYVLESIIVQTRVSEMLPTVSGAEQVSEVLTEASETSCTKNFIQSLEQSPTTQPLPSPESSVVTSKGLTYSVEPLFDVAKMYTDHVKPSSDSMKHPLTVPTKGDHFESLESDVSPIDMFSKVPEEKAINVVKQVQSSNVKPLETTTCETITIINFTSSIADQCISSLETPQPLPDKVLRQLSTSAQEILPQWQHPCVLSQSINTSIVSDTSDPLVNIEYDHRNINNSESVLNEGYVITDIEEDRVSEDSLVECIDDNTPGLNKISDDDDDAGNGNAETEPSDSLDEENSVGSDNDGHTSLEEKPRQIDIYQAKLRASLSWLLSKVYGSNIPKELQDPFYETAEGQLVLRPVMVNLMSSSELYCQACSNMFPETHTQWQGHWSIIQVLSRKGIYISEVQESAVTETVLVQTAPFRLKAHLALIDALMKAYTCEVASVEKVVKAVRRITTFPASSELPGTPEEALIFWINKVCTVLGTEGVSKGRSDEVIEGMAGQKVRVLSRGLLHHEPAQVPLLEDLMSDIGDGCSVAAVIAYYRPHLLNIKDLCLKEGIGIADSLHNLRQIGQFCQNHLPRKCFHLSYEDLLYAQDIMKVNITAFLADLFSYFEGSDSCQAEDSGLGSAKPTSEKVDAMPAAGKKNSQTVHPGVPISHVTKRSFHRQSFDETSSNLGMGRSAVSNQTLHQPLLSKRIAGRHCIPQEEGGTSVSTPTKRHSGRRTVSLCSPQDREVIHKSVLAWQDDQRIQHRSDERDCGGRGHGRLLANVSIDTALNENFNNSSLSLDLSGLEMSCHSDYTELESATSGHPRIPSPKLQTDHMGSRTPTNSDQKLEPLMPALLKPTKEKEINLSKAEERGDRSPRRKKVTSPLEPQPPSISQTQRLAVQLPQQRRQHLLENDGSLSVPSDETTVSALPPGGRSQSPYIKPQSQSPRGRTYEAFVVGPDSKTDISLDISLETMSRQGKSGSVSQSDLGRDISTAGSYTVKDRPISVQAARAAGIPVVSDSEDTTLTTDRSREGSIASSGEYSDHESQKIHQEYKVRESGIVTTPGSKVADANINNNSKPVMLISDHLSSVTSGGGDDGGIFSKLSSNTTNFAELKRLKDKLGYNLDKVDRSALIYMQSGSHGGPYDKMSGLDFKSAFVSKQGQGQQLSKGASDKPSTMGQHPERSSPALIQDNATLEVSEANPGSLEMQQLKLKLEQKRKDIERKKYRQEAQQSKMRQQLGKAAFMRVVSKHTDGGVEGESSDQVDTGRSEHIPNSSQSQLQARLGHPTQKLPLSSSPRSPLPTHPHPQQTTVGQGGQNSVIPADVSAQRFTDWRIQSQLSKGGGGNLSTMTATDNKGKNKDQTQQFLLMRTVSDASSDHSSASSETSVNKAFSREGIQQTIDTVRNKWFANDTDLVSGGRGGSEEDDANGTSFKLHDDDLLAGARAMVIQEHSRTPSRSHSQSPLQGISQGIPTHYADTTRETASPPRLVSDLEYQEYDSSLDKLNYSLTELQGEIMRLSLQHEQLRAAQSPGSGLSPRINGGSAVTGIPPAQSRPIHGIPQQGPYMQGVMTNPGVSLSLSQQQVLPTISAAQQNDSSLVGDSSLAVYSDSLQPAVSDISPENMSAYKNDLTPDQLRRNLSEPEDIMDVTNDGFFVSFGGNTTPKRMKPKLSEIRARGVSPAPAAEQATKPFAVTVTSNTVGVSDDVAANLAGQTIVATSNPQKNNECSDEPSPKIGFIVKDEAAAVRENAIEDEMQKKKIKLIEMQRKRKEEQEKKRIEKEVEAARKQEEKQFKEEEQERKKADEKARRETIFQQYLQKKQEDEESPVKSHPKRRDASASKQRPKSMFVKAKAMTPEPGALAPDSGSSSQEDLTGRTNMSGRSTPGVMSALRSSFHFRLPQPGQIRKAVSCNTLQGASNGAQGPNTYRRPPSPDMSRVKQQRQRGSSQESGIETGSVAVPDYAGPKLFVKPSAKSNRHIVVNAISHCCLAGSVNTDIKNKVLEELSKCDANHFLILFRDAGCQYRGLFIFYPETEEAFKIYGVGPKHIINAMCEKFYKYNSGAKSFSEITSTKHLSVSVDAVVLHTAVWKSVKAVIKR